MTRESHDAVVVGAGPNGLTAAVCLAREGFSVLVVEAADVPGGGARTAELTLPGFLHDTCSAVHPLGALSPIFRALPLERHGLRWRSATVSAAHPLDGGRAALLRRGLDETAATLDDGDGRRWRRLVAPFLRHPDRLFADLLGPPLRWPRQPLTMLRFAWRGLRAAAPLARARFRGELARALFAGCAAHAIMPLERRPTAAVGLLFALAGHAADWPCAEGGSAAITRALVGILREHGGELRTGHRVASAADLPPARIHLLDLSPGQVARVAADRLPAGYLRRLRRFRLGPGVFKLDWALDGPIPWEAPGCGDASTVHVGGTLEEVAAAEAAVWRGEHPERPFVLVCQQSVLDATRAPAGRHTGYAYCHVPAGSTVDMTARIEAQIERFAPGFRDRVLARHATTPADLQRGNANLVGGAISGGVADLRQLLARPVLRRDPHATPDPRIFLCSASTPPGAGVHGMAGYWAARSAARRLRRGVRPVSPGGSGG